MEHKAFNAAFKEQLLDLIAANNGGDRGSYRFRMENEHGSTIFTVEGKGMGAREPFPAVEAQLKASGIHDVKIRFGNGTLHVAVHATDESLGRIGQAVQAAKDAPAEKMRKDLREKLAHTLDAMMRKAGGVVGSDNAPEEVRSAVRDVLASRGMDTGEAPGFAGRMANPSNIVELAARQRAPKGASRGSAGRG